MQPYYQDNYCTIYHGDCRELLSQMPKVDLVLTDPPYGINADKNKRANTQYGKALYPSTDYGLGDWDNNPIDASLISKILKFWYYFTSC